MTSLLSVLCHRAPSAETKQTILKISKQNLARVRSHHTYDFVCQQDELANMTALIVEVVEGTERLNRQT